jgi:ClpP class serine protease
VAQAAADPSVRSVLIDLDSPGGAVAGCFGAARAMRAALVASGKPSMAVASEMACSAAYALACVADEIVVPETGIVGSVGVIGTVTSLARMYAAAGIDQRVVASGGAKGDGHPALTITPEALARAQERIDSAAAVFAGWVADRRAMTPDAVMALDARVLTGAAAVAAGLADRVDSYDSTLATLRRRAAPAPVGALTQRFTMHPVLAALGVTSDADGLQAATALLSLRAQVHAATGTTDDAAALGAMHALKRDAAAANDLRAQLEADRKAATARERASILDAAVSAMQLTPAERAADGSPEAWTTALDNAGLRAFAARAGAVPAARPRQPTAPAAQGSALTDEQRALADQLGISHDDYAKALAAQG